MKPGKPQSAVIKSLRLSSPEAEVWSVSQQVTQKIQATVAVARRKISLVGANAGFPFDFRLEVNEIEW